MERLLGSIRLWGDHCLHWVLLWPKVWIISILRVKNRLWEQAKFPKQAPLGGYPRYSLIEKEYVSCCEMAETHAVSGPKGWLLLIRGNPARPTDLNGDNSDHQGIRQGALAWAYDRPWVVSGMQNFMVDGEFKRGVESGPPWVWNGMSAPPAIGLAVCQAVNAFLSGGDGSQKRELPGEFKQDFVRCLDRLIEKEFENADASVRPRLSSNGFDALYSSSLLTTGWRLTRDERYKAKLYEILDKRGFRTLLRAPVSYLSWEKRPYFLEHLSMVGLYSCVLACGFDEELRELYKRAMIFVGSQSTLWANPYFAALRADCGAIDPEETLTVLEAHRDASPSLAMANRTVSLTPAYPMDWGDMHNDEFNFDDTPKGVLSNPLYFGPVIRQVPLNGVVLGASLMKLMRATGKGILERAPV